MHEHFFNADAFSRQIAIERSRSDRFGIPFIVMRFIISPELRDYQARALQVLASVLHDRSRLIDTKGWSENQLAIILPGADHTNADIVGKAYLDLFRQRFSLGKRSSAIVEEPLLCEVFAYPDYSEFALSRKRVSVPNTNTNLDAMPAVSFVSMSDYNHNTNKALDGVV